MFLKCINILVKSLFFLLSFLILFYMFFELQMYKISTISGKCFYSAWFGAYSSLFCLWVKYPETKKVWFYKTCFLLLFFGYLLVMLEI
jgi:hypothetical protein